MASIPSGCSVLIVGAGTAGLMMAAQLLRNGVHPVIIDSKIQPSQHSKAIAIEAYSLEIFRQLGLDTQALKLGNFVNSIAIHDDADKSTVFPFNSEKDYNTPHSGILILEQSKTERLLIDYLTANACPIYWNASLMDFQEMENGIAAELNTCDRSFSISTKWLIGADGANSCIRKKLNISFRHTSDERRFYVADIIPGQEIASNILHLFLKNEACTAFYPISNRRLRIIADLPKSLKHRNDISFESLKPFLTFVIGFAIEVEQCTWFSIYPTQSGIAEVFQSQNCFLIGDAAHTHLPITGNGMNAGFQDANNLAWKLTAVIKGFLPDQILQSYSAERKPLVEQILKIAERINSPTLSNKWINFFKNKLMPYVKKNSSENPFHYIFKTDINYRNSSLSVHHSTLNHLKAGDRLPYIQFYDEKKAVVTDLHQWCSKPGFTLLVIGKLSSRDLFLIAKWITSTYPHNLHFYYLPPSQKNQHVFDLFEMTENNKKAIIIRADMHIGYINDAIIIEMLDIYLSETLGWVKQKED